ncbi:CsgG/HfaB family protein [Elusimicrobiota bacterium]
MKKLKYLLVIMTFMVSSCATTGTKELNTLSADSKKVLKIKTGPKMKVAVVDFENKSKYGQARLGSSASDILVTELAKTGKFLLIEREKIEKIMMEQSFSMTGAVDPQTAVLAGKLLGASYLLTGSISQFGVNITSSDYLITAGKKQTAEAAVDVRVIDTETGSIILAESGKGEASKKTKELLGMGKSSGYDERLEGEALRAAIVSTVKNIVKTLGEKPWCCTVAEVDGDSIYLDAGKESGLKTDDTLQLFRLGKEIKSPSSGLLIGRKKEKIGEIKIGEYFGSNGSIAELKTGSKPLAGDRAFFPGRH